MEKEGSFKFHITNRRKFLKEFLVILASCTNYACVFFLTVLLHVELGIFLVAMAILGFFISILILNVGRSLAYSCLSLIIGASLSVILLVSPPLVYGEMWDVNYTLEAALQPVMRLLLFAIVFSFVGVLLGSFISDAF